jgi:hypothetical protein
MLHQCFALHWFRVRQYCGSGSGSDAKKIRNQKTKPRRRNGPGSLVLNLRSGSGYRVTVICNDADGLWLSDQVPGTCFLRSACRRRPRRRRLRGPTYLVPGAEGSCEEASPGGSVRRAPPGEAPGWGAPSAGWAPLLPATRHFPIPMSWAKI